MAACGLAPGLGEMHDLKKDHRSHSVITLLELASEMLKIVPEFNKVSMQDCKLRIGKIKVELHRGKGLFLLQCDGSPSSSTKKVGF